MGRNTYITTTLPYVNAEPHIGFALEIVQADIYARYREALGDRVFFNTGTDEHGTKIYGKAQEAGEAPQVYTDRYAARFQSLKEMLGLHPALHFIRTTDEHHKRAAQELWRRCEAKGDIYKKKYKGLYCVGDEMFLRESDLVEGKCPNHPNMQPQEIEEENYFFRLSAYQEALTTYLSKEGAIMPTWRREEALRFVERGLEDVSISREKERLPWGVAVPGDESQVMYVWFDALTNYISTLGWPDDTEGNFAAFWREGDVLQVAGKDQVRFQSILWQAMLMSGGVKNSDRIIYHGFITSGGQKMSKSLGNVISPLEIVNEYGIDALRCFLARHVHPFEDSDVTLERFKEAYNADLANGLGNLAARIMQLAQTHLSGPVDEPVGSTVFPEEYAMMIETFQFNHACEYVWARIAQVDHDIATEKPFSVVKTDPEKGRKMIAECVEELRLIARMLQPILPQTSEKILMSISANAKPENLFPRK